MSRGLLAVAPLLVGAVLVSTSWTPSEAPTPSNASPNEPDSILTAVSCPTMGYCVGGGSYEDGSFDRNGLLDILSGGSWTAAQAPVPGNVYTGIGALNSPIDSVSCSSEGSCVAVGYYDANVSGQVGLIDTLSEGEWSAIEAPLPSNAATSRQSVALSEVSCSQITTCVAIGTYLDSSGFSHPLIESLSDGLWTGIEALDPSDASQPAFGSSTDVAGVSCSQTVCVVVGYYFTDASQGGVAQRGLIDSFSGGAWSTIEAPFPADAPVGAFDSLTAVSRVSSSSCTAVGEYDSSSTDEQSAASLIESFSGSNWIATISPPPSATISVMLPSVSCGTSTFCGAVGTVQDNSVTDGLVAYTDTLESGTWTPARAPLPAGADASMGSELVSTSCTSDGSCTAVGGYSQTSPFSGMAMIVTLSGTAWTAVQAPVPNNAGYSVFNANSPSAIACPAVGSCVAVGAYAPPDSLGHALIESEETAPPSETPEAPFAIALPALAALVMGTLFSSRRRRQRLSR